MKIIMLESTFCVDLDVPFAFVYLNLKSVHRVPTHAHAHSSLHVLSWSGTSVWRGRSELVLLIYQEMCLRGHPLRREQIALSVYN